LSPIVTVTAPAFSPQQNEADVWKPEGNFPYSGADWRWQFFLTGCVNRVLKADGEAVKWMGYLDEINVRPAMAKLLSETRPSVHECAKE
jgi:hypothetical protein